MGYKDKYKGQNWQHGWPAEVVKAIIAQLAGKIAHLAREVNWDEPDVTNLADKVAHAFSGNMRVVSVVISSKVEGRGRWYEAIDRIRKYGVCCLETEIVDNPSNYPVGSNEAMLRIIVISEGEVAYFNSNHPTLSPYTRVLRVVIKDDEFQHLFSHVKAWKDQWRPIE